MATPNPAAAPPGQPERQPGVENVVPFPRQIDGDFFDPGAELIVTRNPVVGREEVEQGSFRQGTTELEIFTLENGRPYEVVRGTPKNQRSDIGIFIGTALGTSIRGHNWHTMLQMMDEGYPVTLIGAEGGHEHWPRNPAATKQFLHNLLHISIGETAANMHEILNELDQDPNPIAKKGVSIKSGESRDAAVGIGFNALAPVYDRQVVYSDLIAACFPHAKRLKIHPSLIPRAVQLGAQVGSLFINAVPMHPKRAWHYVRTVNPNPHFMAHVAATIPTLVSGQAGSLARQVDSEAMVHMTHFEDDPWTDIPGWLEEFGDHPHVVHEIQPGDHGAIVRPDTQRNRHVRFRSLREELEANHQRPERVDWEHVYMSGQLAVAAA
jgi:hypothetical protein